MCLCALCDVFSLLSLSLSALLTLFLNVFVHSFLRACWWNVHSLMHRTSFFVFYCFSFTGSANCMHPLLHQSRVMWIFIWIWEERLHRSVHTFQEKSLMMFFAWRSIYCFLNYSLDMHLISISAIVCIIVSRCEYHLISGKATSLSLSLCLSLTH